MADRTQQRTSARTSSRPESPSLTGRTRWARWARWTRSARWAPQDRILLGLLAFNALSSFVGGIALMTGLIPEQVQVLWVQHTGFGSGYFPGVILMAVVGGSALVAALAMHKGAPGWEICSVLSAVVMIVWIVGEIASIRAFHILQLVYLVTGVAVLWATPSRLAIAVDSPTAPGPGRTG